MLGETIYSTDVNPNYSNQVERLCLACEWIDFLAMWTSSSSKNIIKGNFHEWTGYKEDFQNYWNIVILQSGELFKRNL